MRNCKPLQASFQFLIITEVLSESTRETASVFSSKTDVFSNLEVQSANFASASAQNFELVSKFTSCSLYYNYENLSANIFKPHPTKNQIRPSINAQKSISRVKNLFQSKKQHFNTSNSHYDRKNYRNRFCFYFI